ncbi:4Fe-4S dicluster domain-containing protein [Thioflexithrix psekupsensis]|uniref:Sulfite reductase subunit A n=1 Tax=Thioflexithrix psekupsensis TaxID=1570016 RepID=A0A251XBQ8_9GAMM|nr:4Fe-4S dicluster domain-containing protein [Thioflexithrix psekupsensis]OUD15587.1 sulfite reductase subunit A [Thioflexithrix psekupsensis]
MQFLARDHLQSLLDVLIRSGYRCLGPQIRDGAIVFDTLTLVSQLPRGVRDQQSPGRYQLTDSDDPRYFLWANGPQALKPLTFAPREVLWKVERDTRGNLSFVETLPTPIPTAVIGVRGCDLAALQLQDQHFCYQDYADTYYNRRRRSLFLIALDCAHPADTCFCHSTGDGPDVQSGFDMALTELDDGFLLRVKSEKAKEIAAQLPLIEARPEHYQAATAQHQAAIAAQTRHLASRHLSEALFSQLDHPRWAEVAARCLSCTNCTSVCPTCFCHNQTEEASFDGKNSTHYRQWDSCFTSGHSYMHSFVLRDSALLRYRQWLTHKLGSWHEQYGRSGCVGCGRCITWCPVGIDITEEANIISGVSAHA